MGDLRGTQGEPKQAGFPVASPRHPPPDCAPVTRTPATGSRPERHPRGMTGSPRPTLTLSQHRHVAELEMPRTSGYGQLRLPRCPLALQLEPPDSHARRIAAARARAGYVIEARPAPLVHAAASGRGADSLGAGPGGERAWTPGEGRSDVIRSKARGQRSGNLRLSKFLY